MKGGHGLWGWLVAVAVFIGIAGGTGVAEAYKISGTIKNYSSKPGSRVYLSVKDQNGNDTGAGVSVASPWAGTNFSNYSTHGFVNYSAHGLQGGSYVVSAFLDGRTSGTSATHHAPDPSGSSQTVNISGTDVSGANITLTDPSPTPALQAPTINGVLPGPGGALVSWKTPKDNNGNELAYSYNVYWSTSSTIDITNPASYTGKTTGIPANDNGMYIHSVASGNFYYVVTAQRGTNGQTGSSESDPSAFYGPVHIGAIPSDNATTFDVSGTVTIDGGIVPTGPLYIVTYANGPNMRITKIASPGASNPFTITGVPNGTYQIFAVLDQNNDGSIWAGDYSVLKNSAPFVTVNGVGVSNVTATIPKLNAETSVSTSHSFDASGREGFGLSFDIEQGNRLPVNASIRAGQDIAGPVDLGVRDGRLSYWVSGVARPTPGTIYTLDLGYADGTAESVPVAVTAVLDSFPTPVSPMGKVLFAPTPTFSWSAPASPPAGGYTYSLNVNGNNLWWNPDNSFPSSQTQAIFNFDNRASGSLSDNSSYTWSIAVKDANGNQASKEAAFFSGGSISGKVTDSANVGVSGVFVQLYDGNGNNMPWNYNTTTAADGSYTVGGLASGTYRVCFNPGQTGYVGRCYGTQAYDSSKATNILLTSPNDVANISVTLTRGAAISGTVTTASGGGIAGVQVELHDSQGNGVPNGGMTTTDQSGAYAMQGVPAGTYTIYFNGGNSGYVSGWYKTNGENNFATPVGVAAGDNKTGIDGILSSGGSISGTVTAVAGGPVSGVQVELHDPQGNWISGMLSKSTGSNGAYTIQGVPAGTYTIYFNGSWAGYIGQWYDGLSGINGATSVNMDSGQTRTGINAILTPGGSISGTVTDKNSAAPIAGINVQLYDAQGNGISGVGGAMTAADGTYSVKGLPSGSYKVCFTSGSTSYIGACYDQQPLYSPNSSLVAVIAPGDKPGINAQLSSGGTITGRVTDGSNGISQLRVELYDQNGNSVQGNNYAMTNPDGTYSLGGIPSGSYKVFFNGASTGYIGQWYTTAAQVTVIGVTAGQTQPGIDAALTLGGTITGKVTDRNTGLGIKDISVQIADGSGNSIPGIWGINTDAGGNYTIRGLSGGTYKICFSAGTTSYIGRCYNDKAMSFNSADPVPVTAQNITANINGALALGGTVSGRVTNGTLGLSNVWVELRDTNGSSVPGVSGALTNVNGNYSLSGVPAGTYTVYFSPGPGSYATQWYNGKSSAQNADHVIISAGQNLGNVNAVLVQVGSIGGTVNGPQGPLSNVTVQLADLSGVLLPYAVGTGPDGTYLLGNVPAGSYKLYFNAGASGYVSRWYNDRPDSGSADQIALGGGQNLTGYNATLDLGGTITGWVRNSSSAGIAGVIVQLYDGNNVLLPYSATTDGGGNYSLFGVAAGSYKLYFSADQSGYYSQWYNSQNLVDVVAGDTTNPSDVFLASKATTTVTLATSLSPAVYGQQMTFTATVNPPGVTGKVQFKLNGAPLQQAVDLTLQGGTPTASKASATLAAGIYSVTAAYTGDANYAPGASAVVMQTINKADTTTALSSDTGSTIYGQQVTFTATVSAVAPGSGIPTGSVTFKDGSNPVGTATLDGTGKATFSTTTLATGSHIITASYGSDGNFQSNNPSNASLEIVTSPPTISKAFGAASVPLNGTTTLSFTLTNPNPTTTLTGIGFTDALPAGLTVATPNGLTGSCGGGTITAVGGTSSVSLSGAILLSSGSCTFSVNVTGTGAGTKNNTTSAVTSTEGGNGGTASASMAVVAPPAVSNSFYAAAIPLNGSTALTFTITNPVANTVALSGVAFTNTLPAGIVVATPNGLNNTCGGTVTAVAGSSSVTLSGATIASNTSCTLTVNVTGMASGNFTNTSGTVTSTNGGTGNSASANLVVAAAPAISESFGAGSIPQNGTTSLSFTINNPNTTIPLSGVAFADSLPAGLVVASPNGLTGSCGSGTITAVPGASSVSLSGSTLSSTASCTFSVNVTGTTAGVKNNSVTVTSTTAGTGNTSNASFTVTALADLAVTKTAPATATPLNNLTYTITVTNNGPGDAQNVSATDPLPANTTFVSESLAGGSGWTASTPAVGANGTVTFTKASVAAGEAAIFQIVTNIGAGAANGSTISNTATVAASTGDPDAANNSSTATSTVASVPPVMSGATPYQKLQDAFNQVSSSGTIKLLDIQLPDVGPTLSRNLSIFLQGGYDGSYTTHGGWSTILGPLTIGAGSLTIERVVIR